MLYLHMEERIEEIARYTGQIVAIIDMMNQEFPEFQSIFAFKILCNPQETINGANVGDKVCGADLTDFMCSITDAYASKNIEGSDFDLDLKILIEKLKSDLNGRK